MCVQGRDLNWPWSSPEWITPPERRKIQSMLGSVIKGRISLISNLTHLKTLQAVSKLKSIYVERTVCLRTHSFPDMLSAFLLFLSSLPLYISLCMTSSSPRFFFWFPLSTLISFPLLLFFSDDAGG